MIAYKIAKGFLIVSMGYILNNLLFPLRYLKNKIPLPNKYNLKKSVILQFYRFFVAVMHFGILNFAPG